MSEGQEVMRPRRTRMKAPAITPEEREKQLISLAVDDVERKLRDGRAPTAVLVHYLKLATTREELEKKKLEKEIALLESRKQVADSSMRMEQLIQNALSALTTYGSSINSDEAEES